MVHVRATPGAPRSTRSPDELVQIATHEAKTLLDAGLDGLIIENMHDAPYVHGEDLGPAVVAIMARVAASVRRLTDRPVGVQILSGGNREAIAIAHAAGLDFIRCENFVFSHIADEGLLAKAEAGPLLRYRNAIGAQRVRIFADIKKKHASHAITADVSINDAVAAAEFFGADGVIVTGTHTGRASDAADVAEARAASGLPVLIGSGVTPTNIDAAFEHADAVIVGSALKEDGHWANDLDPDRIAAVIRNKGGG